MAIKQTAGATTPFPFRKKQISKDVIKIATE